MALYEIKDGVGIIPEGKKVIEREAFKNCTALTSIVIPDSVTEIGESAFEGCTGLTSIVIPASLTGFGIVSTFRSPRPSSVFLGCTSLKSIKVSEGNKKYDSRNNCNAIIETATNKLIVGYATTIIPDTVTEIGERAFSGCTNLTSINIPNSVTEIGQYAFEGCTGLTSIVIPDSVTSIGSYRDIFYGSKYSGNIIFRGCTGLTSIKVSEGNKVYDSRNNCNAIIETEKNRLQESCSTTVIPDSVTEIGKNAFCECTSLTSIDIPHSVTEIASYAFKGCKNLTGIVIPDSVTEIGGCAFEGCTKLTNIDIPDSVKKIWNQAFMDCTGLTSIILPDSVTEIGDSVLKGCNGLKSIVIPESVTYIGPAAFWNCISLTSVVIPNSVSEISEDAFRNTGITEITIPNTVEKIGERAFCSCTSLKTLTINCPITIHNIFSYCSALETLTLGTGIKKIDADNFDGLNLKVINVPAKKADYYKKRLPEKLHGLIVELPEEKNVKKKINKEHISQNQKKGGNMRFLDAIANGENLTGTYDIKHYGVEDEERFSAEDASKFKSAEVEDFVYGPIVCFEMTDGKKVTVPLTKKSKLSPGKVNVEDLKVIILSNIFDDKTIYRIEEVKKTKKK